MTFINTCADVDDLGGGRFRHTQYVKPVAYDDNGTLRAIGNAFTASGIADRPHTVRAARLMTSVADDGMRRIHPTREEDRYVEIGAPYVKIGGVWRKMGFRGGMRAANRLTWVSPQANMSIVHAGHYIKLEIELKRGYVPEDGLVAFPVGLNGLKRSGANILSDGRPVMSLRAPQMYDAANAMDTRAIDAKFVLLAGQPYYLMALPDLTGMSRPVIDPTLTLQPDAAAGKDNYILGSLTNRNYGTNVTWEFGWEGGPWIHRALIQFSLAELPDDAIISSTQLSIYQITHTGDRPVSARAYRLKRAWVETESNWNVYSTGNSWATAGGFGADDCEQTDIGGGLVDMTADTYYTLTLAPTTKAALDLGYGWLVKSALETAFACANCASSNHATAAWRPKLVVEYTLPGGGNIFQSAILHSSLYGKTLVR